MIKFEFSASDQLQATYNNEVISRTKQRMADFILTVPATHRKAFELFFDEAKVEELLNCEPSELLKHIHEVYAAFPVLADRYWPTLLLTAVPIPDDIDKLGVRTPDEKKNLDVICKDVSTFLEALVTEDRHYLSWLLANLKEATTYGAKRKALTMIRVAAQGNNRATEDFLERFPDWVNAFSGVFNYSELSAVMGHNIIDEWKIDVCLYCNQEPIQTQGKLFKQRADLDHFYPRTK